MLEYPARTFRHAAVWHVSSALARQLAAVFELLHEQPYATGDGQGAGHASGSSMRPMSARCRPSSIAITAPSPADAAQLVLTCCQQPEPKLIETTRRSAKSRKSNAPKTQQTARAMSPRKLSVSALRHVILARPCRK
eukprot:768741-Hanusia_phi.AAC.6